MISYKSESDIIPIDSFYSAIYRLFNKDAGIQQYKLVHYDEFFEGMELNITDTNNKPVNAEVYFRFVSAYSSKMNNI
jgi:hypothetical protein